MKRRSTAINAVRLTLAAALVVMLSAASSSHPAAPVAAGAGVVSDGIWRVGRDVPAGTYQATADVSPQCYWWQYIDFDRIVGYGVPGGGRPVVTLEAGQTFQAWHCGTWSAVAK